MSRLSAVFAAIMMLVTTPLARAESQPAPVLWDGIVVDADGRAAPAEVVAFARPAAADLPATGNALVPIARTTTDASGRYTLRTGYSKALRAVEDESGWANVMVVAFGEDGTMSLAVDSVAWAPKQRGGDYRSSGDNDWNWVTTPAQRLAAQRGTLQATGTDAASTARERPAVMALTAGGMQRPGASTMATPPPTREAGMCVGPHKTEDLGIHFTPVGELHLNQAWRGKFSYTTAQSTSFQVGFRAEGKRWSAGGSTSSVKGHSSDTGNDFLPENHMYTFSADLVYKRYTWKCNRAEAWHWVETVEPALWAGGLWRTDHGTPPPCNPNKRSPVPPNGYHGRGASESITLEGAVSVAGFSGSMTMTVARGVQYGWQNDRNHHRYLCGTSAFISQDTRITSLT